MKKNYDEKKLTRDFSWCLKQSSDAWVENGIIECNVSSDTFFYKLKVAMTSSITGKPGRKTHGYISIPYLVNNGVKLDCKGVVDMVFDLFSEKLKNEEFNSCCIYFPTGHERGVGYVPIINFWRYSDDNTLRFDKVMLDYIPDCFPQVRDIFEPAYLETCDLCDKKNELLYCSLYGWDNMTKIPRNVKIDKESMIVK